MKPSLFSLALAGMALLSPPSPVLAGPLYTMKVPVPGLRLANATANPPVNAPAQLQQFGSYRAWSDGTLAASCQAYRQGDANHAYTGATGDGQYRILVEGNPVDVSCDMTTDGGGWTVVIASPATTAADLAKLADVSGLGTLTTDSSKGLSWGDLTMATLGLKNLGQLAFRVTYSANYTSGWGSLVVESTNRAGQAWSNSQGVFSVYDAWTSDTNKQQVVVDGVASTVGALAGVTFQSRVYASASAFQFWNMGRPSSAGAYQRRYIAYLAIR